MSKQLSKERVIQTLENKYPGFETSICGWDSDDEAKIRFSAEDGLTDRNGDELFNYYDMSGERYTFGVVTHLHRWLDRKGWACEWINAGEMHLWKRGHYGW